MNQTNVKVSFYLKKSEADADGNCLVMAKLNIGKYSEAAFSVKMKAPQSRWASGRASGKSVAAKGKKTKVEFEVPLLELPLHILQKYRDAAPGDKLLPVYCNSMLNLYLKEIARICRIDRPLVFHQARHNFGTHITLSLGVPIETVSRMMGHTSISTMQIYAQVTDTKVDEVAIASNPGSSHVFHAWQSI